MNTLNATQIDYDKIIQKYKTIVVSLESEISFSDNIVQNIVYPKENTPKEMELSLNKLSCTLGENLLNKIVEVKYKYFLYDEWEKFCASLNTVIKSFCNLFCDSDMEDFVKAQFNTLLANSSQRIKEYISHLISANMSVNKVTGTLEISPAYN
ncbi:MAG: hypothetical protein WCQ67_09190 [Treponema sp.]